MYSCARCTGLRVWKPTTRRQPRSANAARVWAGSTCRSGKSGSGRANTVTCPPTRTLPSAYTWATPGWASSVVRKTLAASSRRSASNTSATSMTASSSPPWLSSASRPAVGFSGRDSVTGSAHGRPFSRCMSETTRS